ncbi:hypothetical protein M2409_005394 [Sphingobacterium sp. JUb21]|nr:hypothetical protein [Sphingobacterium sp. JUb21]
MKDLRAIIKDEKTAKIFSYLHSSKTDIYITEAKSVTGSVMEAAGDKEKGENLQMKESGVSHTGRGLEIEYSQLNGVKMQDVEKTNSAGTLAHELTHVRDVLNGQEGKDYKMGVQKGLKGLDREKYVRSQMEKRAVESENRIRILFGLPERKTYMGQKIK